MKDAEITMSEQLRLVARWLDSRAPVMAKACRQAAAEIAAQPSQVVDSGCDIKISGGAWLPIATAPRDGTPVALYSPGRVTFGQWSPEQWPTAAEYHASTGEYLGQHETGQCINAYWASWDGGFTDEDPPTHWMPLPPPPAA